jgi:long-chain acyl-CoA synthetase
VVIPLEAGGNAEPCAILLLGGTGIPGGASSPEALAQIAVDSANSTLAEYQRIHRWLLWPDPDFPRTPTGKPRLAAIAERALQQMRLPTASESEAANCSTSFPSLPSSLRDLSSLDRVELLSTLEHRYNLELNETQFANAQTADDLKQLLSQPSTGRSDHAFPRWTQLEPVRLFRLLVYYALTWPATILLAHPKIVGCENLDSLRGPALFVANHTTRRADIGLILFALPARFRHRLATAMGGENLHEFRHPPGEWFFAKRWLWRLNYFLVVSLFNVFPLPQFSGFRESFRFAGGSADRGYSLLVFPEGVINDRSTPEMVPFQQGIGLLAQNLQIPIVPMRLDGVWRMKQESRRLAHLAELTVHIGAPVNFPPDAPPAVIAAQLQSIVQSL